MEAHSPKTTSEMFVKAAVLRHKRGYVEAFAKGIMGGVLLSMGGLIAVTLGGGEVALTSVYPGLNKLITATVFPFGLIIIVLTGADLSTSNMAIFMMSSIKGKTPWWSGFPNVFIVLIGNIIGSLIVAALFGQSSGLFTGSYSTYAVRFATTKVVTPTWANILVRGIGCNFVRGGPPSLLKASLTGNFFSRLYPQLVCIAVWQATASREVISKIFAIEFPILLFVAMGFDHVVANAFFVPLGILLGADFTVGYYIWKSLIPSFIGNVIGASFLALPLCYFYLFDDDELPGPGSGLVELGTGSRMGKVSAFFGKKDLSSVRVTHADSDENTV